MRDTLIDEHPLLNLLFKKSLKDPIDLRVLIIVTSFNLMFASNALFFSDDYIDRRAGADKEERQSFFYTLAQESLKTIICLIFSTTLESALGIIFEIPNSAKEELNHAMMSKNKENIKEACKNIFILIFLKY
jgi:hypothetical protein